jgi:hypothetical protein
MIVDESFEDDDDKVSDYLGVNIFENTNGEGIVLDMGSLIKKNTITSELTYTFKMELKKNLLNKVLNLVLIQDSRRHDLYFSLWVISSVNCVFNHAANYDNEYEIPLRDDCAGGNPNDSTFYANPQLAFEADGDKFGAPMKVWIQHRCLNEETSCKVFLGKGADRISYLTDENEAAGNEGKYTHRTHAQHFNLLSGESYIAIISSFKQG